MRVRIKVRNKNKSRRAGSATPNKTQAWVAIGVLATGATVGVGQMATPALAQGTPRPAQGRQVSAQPAIRRFDIPANSLGVVIEAFTQATGVQVTFDRPDLAMLPSRGVSGSFTAEEALYRLLEGTKCAHRPTPTGFVIVLDTVRTTIEVSDTIATVALSSPKLSEPIRDLPQTLSIIPRSIIEQQGATSLTEVLRNVPGLTIAAGEGGVPAGDNLTIRGFSARNDVFVDGVRDLGPQTRDPFNLEQVEVVKGPQSAYTGRGSTGGTVNLVSKTPNLNRHFGGSFVFGSAGMQRVTSDINLPLDRLGAGERTAFRMNFVFHDAGTPGRDVVNNRRIGYAPSVTFGAGRPTRFTVSYFGMRQHNIPDYGIPWVTATHNLLPRDTPAPVPRHTFYGLRARDKEAMGANLGTLRFEHDFSDNLNFRSQLRYGRSTRDSITSAPRFASNDSLVIHRNSPNWLTADSIWDNQTDLRARFHTASIEHTVTGGFNLTREHQLRKTRTIEAAPRTTLLDPDPNDPYTGLITLNPNAGDATAYSQAIYFFDTVRLQEKFSLHGGLRWDRFDVSGVSQALAPLVRTDNMVAVRASATYKPVQAGNLYISYGTSLNPSLEALTYQPANVTTDPEKTYTVEGGTKWETFGSRGLLSAAVFNVTKFNARTPGVLPDDPPQVLDGRQRVNGLELGLAGHLTRSWHVFSAYTLMDARIVESNNPVEAGRAFQNTPRNSFNVWSTHRVGKLTAGGGVRFAGKRYGNNSNTRQVDAYWTLDAMASYPVSKHLELRLNLYNLNDAYYFERLGGGHLIPGPARMVMATTNFRF